MQGTLAAGSATVGGVTFNGASGAKSISLDGFELEDVDDRDLDSVIKQNMPGLADVGTVTVESKYSHALLAAALAAVGAQGPVIVVIASTTINWGDGWIRGLPQVTTNQKGEQIGIRVTIRLNALPEVS